MGRNIKSRHERGYGAAWVRLRQQALARDGYLCQPCLKADRPTPAQEVDHITPKAQGGQDDLDNLQAICRQCHEAKTRQENKRGAAFDAKGFPVWH